MRIEPLKKTTVACACLALCTSAIPGAALAQHAEPAGDESTAELLAENDFTPVPELTNSHFTLAVPPVFGGLTETRSYPIDGTKKLQTFYTNYPIESDKREFNRLLAGEAPFDGGLLVLFELPEGWNSTLVSMDEGPAVASGDNDLNLPIAGSLTLHYKVGKGAKETSFDIQMIYLDADEEVPPYAAKESRSRAIVEKMVVPDGGGVSRYIPGDEENPAGSIEGYGYAVREYGTALTGIEQSFVMDSDSEDRLMYLPQGTTISLSTGALIPSGSENTLTVTDFLRHTSQQVRIKENEVFESKDKLTIGEDGWYTLSFTAGSHRPEAHDKPHSTVLVLYGTTPFSPGAEHPDEVRIYTLAGDVLRPAYSDTVVPAGGWTNYAWFSPFKEGIAANEIEPGDENGNENTGSDGAGDAPGNIPSGGQDAGGAPGSGPDADAAGGGRGGTKATDGGSSIAKTADGIAAGVAIAAAAAAGAVAFASGVRRKRG